MNKSTDAQSNRGFEQASKSPRNKGQFTSVHLGGYVRSMG